MKNNGGSFREVKLVCRQSMKITLLWDNRSSASGAHTHWFQHRAISTFLWPLACSDVSTKQLWFHWKEEITEEEKCLEELLQTNEYFTYQVRHSVHQSYSNLIFRFVKHVKFTYKSRGVSSYLINKRTFMSLLPDVL